VAQYPDNPCLGHRPIKYGVPQEYKWMTYKETADVVDSVAAGVMALGLKQHGRIGVYGINSPEWMMAMQVSTHFCLYLSGNKSSAPSLFSHRDAWQFLPESVLLSSI
jgi:hypothetical protein